MGKATFYRKQKLGCVNYLVVFLPLIGGTLFLVGSLFFWPGFGIYQHELRHLGPDGRPIAVSHAEDMGNSTTTHRLCLFYSVYFDENHTFRLEHEQCAELMEWIGALAFLLGSACYFLAPLIDWIELKVHPRLYRRHRAAVTRQTATRQTRQLALPLVRQKKVR